MRATAFAAIVLLVANTAFAQPSSLNTLEQGLQPPGGPGGAAAGAPNGYLGAELDDENGNGVRVKSVRPGTPADKSGLKTNDLIVDIDGKKIRNLNDYDAVAIRPSGARMVFKVERDGRPQQLAVTLGTRGNTPPAAVSDNTQPEPATGAPSLTAPDGGQPLPSTQPSPGAFNPGLQSPSLTPPGGSSSSTLPPLTLPSDSSPRTGGITAQPLDTLPGPATTPSLPSAGSSTGGGNASLGITVGSATQPTSRATRRGAYIAAVKPGSPAGIAGLPVGGVIVQMDSQKINSDDDLINAIRAARPGQEVELSYYDSADRFGKKFVRLGESGAAPGSSSSPASGGFAAPGGGFGSSTAQNPASPLPETPARGGIGGNGRPLINRVEQMAENFSRGAGLTPGAPPLKTTTVYDPLAMAALQRTVQELTATVNSLEERIRALEGKAGISPPPAGTAGSSSSPFGTSPGAGGSAPFGSPQTPGFNSPSPSFTPGFAPSGTNP